MTIHNKNTPAVICDKYVKIRNVLKSTSTIAARWNPFIFRGKDTLDLALAWVAIRDLDFEKAILPETVDELIQAWCKAAPLTADTHKYDDLFQDTGRLFAVNTLSSAGVRWLGFNLDEFTNFKLIYKQTHFALAIPPEKQLVIDDVSLMRCNIELPASYAVARKTGELDIYRNFHSLWNIIRADLPVNSHERVYEYNEILSPDDMVKLRQYIFVAYNDQIANWVFKDTPCSLIDYFNISMQDTSQLKNTLRTFLELDLPITQLEDFLFDSNKLKSEPLPNLSI